MPPDMYRVFNFKIDGHQFPFVDYPSKAYYEALIVEWATLCKLEGRNSAGRRRVRCVHCGLVFTSKQRLNSHRYVKGCEEARLSDGGPAALYPYPNLNVGRGKFVEMLAKGKGVDFDRVAKEGTAVPVPRKATTGDFNTDGDQSLSGEEEDDDSDFEKIPPRKAAPAYGDSGVPNVKGRAVSGTFTLLPVRPGYTCGPPKGGRTGAPRHKNTSHTLASVVRGSGAKDRERHSLTGFVSGAPAAILDDGLDLDIAVPDAICKRQLRRATRHQRRPDQVGGRASVPDVQHQRQPTRDPRKRTHGSRDVDPGKKTRIGRQAAKKVGGLPDVTHLNVPKTLTAQPPILPEEIQDRAMFVHVKEELVPDVLPPEPQPATLDVCVVWEEKFGNNTDLMRYWAEGKGSPKKVAFYPGLEEYVIGRKEGIRRREALAVAHRRQRMDQRLMLPLVPPTCPPEPVQPGLHRLRGMIGAPCPWNWETSSGEEFKRDWDNSSSTEEFRRGCDTLYVWWRFSMKMGTGVTTKSIAKSITSSLESLCASLVEQEPWPELQELANYIQWHVDFAACEKASIEYRKTLAQFAEDQVRQARTEFREKNAEEIEAAEWDWCPFWHALFGSTHRLVGLPKFPWHHDECEAECEAECVRVALLRSRVPGVQPLPLVRVFKVQRSSHAGQLYPEGTFRQDELMCSQWCDNVSEPRRVLHFPGGECRCVGVMGVQHCGIYDTPQVPENWKDKTIAQLYHLFKIGKRVSNYPEIAWSAEVGEGEEFVEFFGGSGRELRVHVRSFPTMKRDQCMLDTAVVDFFLNHFWFSLSRDKRATIHIMSAEVSEDMERVWYDGSVSTGLWSSFKRKYFDCGGVGQSKVVDEYIVPYFSRDIWSLLIFRRDQLCHFDCASGKGHQLHGEDSEFCRWMYVGWNEVRGDLADGPVPPVVSVDVYPTGSREERGHGIVRQVGKYLKHMCGTQGGQSIDVLFMELLCPWELCDTLQEMLAIVDYELDFRGGRNGEYCAPGRIVPAT